ncbi:MAG: hypothetical protein ABI791_03870 [Acidobacteriota bacterium]
MNNTETLKSGRDLLLNLHKALVDFERESFVAFNGPVTPGQFLTQLLENPDLAWLRSFSTLIVDIDEMFAQKDAFEIDAVDVHLAAMRNLITMESIDSSLKARYEMALQGDAQAAAFHGDIKRLLEL